MPHRPVSQLLREARALLAAAGCEQPALDARLLLQEAAGLSHSGIAAEPERRIEAAAISTFEAFITRRQRHEPVSRILGQREFYGRPFRVTSDVLDPRPDTETLIEAALALAHPPACILDLGTGSGAIIVTLLAELPGATGLATDLSAAALEVARGNAEALGVASRLAFAEGPWWAPVAGRFDLIVSNPPYIPAAEIAGLSPDVGDFDPHLALDGGADGLEPYRRIAAGATIHLNPGGRVLVEIGAGQAPDVEGLFQAHGFASDSAHSDLGGHVRCLVFRLS